MVMRHCAIGCVFVFLLGRPGGDLLSRVLGRSTIGAEGFHGRVRDGIGCIAPRNDHQVIEEERCSGLRPSGCWIDIVYGRYRDARVEEAAKCAGFMRD